MDYLQNHCWCTMSNWDNYMYNCRHIVSLSSYDDGYKEDWKECVVKCSGVPQLKPEIVDWLNKHVPDYDNEDNTTKRGWAIGNEEYRSLNPYKMSIFFQREEDALLFVKTWSKWGFPIVYHNYFEDIIKELDIQ